MGYNLTQSTVERWAPILEKLVDIKEPIKIATNDPEKLAYRLREAVRAAKAIGYKPYESLEITFSTDVGYVIAEPKTELIAVVSGTVLAQHSDEATIQDAQTEFDVVNFMMKVSPQINVINFPNFSGNIEPVLRVAVVQGFTVETEPVLSLRRKADG